MFVHYTDIKGNARISPMAYAISAMPYPSGSAPIPYGESDLQGDDGEKKKSKNNKKKNNKKSRKRDGEKGQAMNAMDWKMMASRISEGKGIKELPIIGGIPQMDGSSHAPEQETGKIYIAALFPNPGDMDSFAGKIASKMSESELEDLKDSIEADGMSTGKKFFNFTADEITRNVVRAVMPSYLLLPLPLPLPLTLPYPYP